MMNDEWGTTHVAIAVDILPSKMPLNEDVNYTQALQKSGMLYQKKYVIQQKAYKKACGVKRLRIYRLKGEVDFISVMLISPAIHPGECQTLF